MACRQMLVVTAAVAVAVAFLPVLAFAAEHLVGDDKGWGLNIDYAQWAGRNEFRIGDTLVFKYPKGKHTVVEVSEADLEMCTKANSLKVWQSGEDKVALDKAGRRRFLCGESDHCQRGMKLNITVFPTVSLAPLSLRVSSSSKTELRIVQAIAAVVAMIAAVLVS